ncbi:TlpA disulfide reductase family protein [Thiomicrospira cyclica]|uniref:Alkyl hydroperoxide reductase/ Thiol specific antioxidant/ Mal allergen n=1 Tax=Thiomicrospira cyclica (strain DSM 14477 / JCM 11371 / ALM1) TaxID=717773 RepID=F6DAF4_THICA|nr:TlpA disulfide reductase family protein [Thiomicrospira cyclica]AEG31120.1 alkyl hydroperoxide reductase/ Thiol specific antioxidant/ Mal allergen [Thiomicrospira cyclica ALM1]
MTPARTTGLLIQLLLSCSLVLFIKPALAMPQAIADWSAQHQIETTFIPAKVTAQTAFQGQLIWLPSEYGRLDQEIQLAQALAERGFDSILPDFFNSLMVEVSRDNLAELPADLWLSLMDAAPRPSFIVAPNRAAVPALDALHDLQSSPQNHIGLILINPDLFVSTPQPGDEPRYVPSVAATNLPIYILQAELSPWRWQLAELRTQLEQQGSTVYTQLLRGLRDRFYFRPDAIELEHEATLHFVDQIARASQLLIPLMNTDRQSAPIHHNELATFPTPPATTDRLQPYGGEQGRDFLLTDLEDIPHRLSDYQGQVILLNFWASWCPPCLYEMPSMARLKTQFNDKDFEILAVNLAERREDFAQFLADNPVNFPILLDPTGSAIQTWRISAYPTTYLIDRQGQIRYALIGGIEWDEPEPVAAVKRLLNE